jgi:hypothetical protein
MVQGRMTAPAEARPVGLDEPVAAEATPPRHLPSHRDLLDVVGSARPATPDAIVVPTIRRAAAIRDALGLGRELGTPVIALCSGKWSTPAAVLDEARRLKAHAIAVAVTDDAKMPRFGCDAVLRARVTGERRSDVSLKRNLGVAAAVMLRWRGVFFLDDDMTDLEPESARATFGLLKDHRAAALDNVGYPDNSVVCHARRAVGLPQDTFTGGGAMAIRADRYASFFPTVYNEDWMFLLRPDRIERVAVNGKVTQLPYDPFLSPERARAEEFGDCLAEGLFALSDVDRPSSAGDVAYWEAFRSDRIRMIEQILALVGRAPEPQREPIRQALLKARGRALSIEAPTYVEYLRAWQADLKRWRTHLDRLPKQSDPVRAFQALGLQATEFRPSTGAIVAL